jgi:putative FmdB family regulatory protein
MPTYEYNCDACSHSFDELQSFSAPLLKKCPKCGKLKLKRAFGTGGAVVFKGSGFYETDYRSDKYKNAAKADQEPAKTEAAPAPAPTGEAKGGSEKKSEKKTPKSGE